MDFKIIYFLDGKRLEASTSNNDIEIYISSTSKEEIKVKALKELTLFKAYLEVPYNYNKNSKIFVNGYQSWTDTKEFGVNDRLTDISKKRLLSKLYSFPYYGDVTFTKYNKHVLHGYDISYILDDKNNNLFIGSYNMDNAYLIIKHDIKKNKLILESDIDGVCLNKNDEFMIYDYEAKIFEKFSDIAYFNEFKPLSSKKIIGYTSWYNHYQDINETKIYEALDGIDNSKFNLFQIDDGYEEFIGDWLDVDLKKFPNSLDNIVKNVHDKGLMAGIWISPFICERKSKLFSKHPDWIKKDNNGNLQTIGSNWSGFYPLDLENEEVWKYIEEVFNKYINMGFDFFKLDFLYAANIFSYEGKSRAMVASKAYKRLRNILKDKLILGCGATITNGLFFDYMRVGPDVSLDFDDKWFMKYMHRERISTKVTIQNTIYRSILNNHFFLNDPDVFLLRDNNINLNYKQRYALGVINSLFGSVLMTSDNVKEYDQDKNNTFDYMLNLFNNATDVTYFKKGDFIKISFKLYDKLYTYIYDTLKGVFING